MKEALLQLARLKKQRPTLKGPADFFSDVLPRLFEGESQDRLPALTPETARAKLAAGVPLLRGESLTVDLEAVRRRWLQISAAVERHQDADAAQALANVVHQNKWNLQEIIEGVLSGTPDLLRARAESLGLDPELAGAVIRLSLLPSLAHLHIQVMSLWQGTLRAGSGSDRTLAPAEPSGQREALADPPREGEASTLAYTAEPPTWERGYCPTCGSWPLLGEFRGLEQIRYLRCGFCAAAWKVPRLLCPFCENRDHRSLGYLSVEGNETKYRINTCDSCRGYIKMLSTLTPLSAPQLLAADIATMHLDLAAAQRGYGVVESGKDAG